MKQKAIITLAIILAVAGALSYGVIWLRKKSASTGSATGADEISTKGSATVINTGTQAIPVANTYAWWIAKLGHAKFPLGMASRGVEVVKVQEVLNALTVSKKLNAAAIKVDGWWGTETQGRFKVLFPSYSGVTLYMYITDFDTTQETLK